MAQYDEIIKHLLDRFAEEFARLAFKTANVEVIAKLDTEQQTIKVHRNDMTFRVRLQNEEVILHIEAQTDDSKDKPMPFRVLAYASTLMLRYESPVYSMVLYLAPNAGRKDPGGYGFGDDTFGLHHKYQVIRLADLEGETFLEVAPVGLLPFIPLMKPTTGTDPEAWLQRCIERTQAAPVDNQTRGTLFLALSTFGSLVYDPNVFQKYISEAMMQESPFYQLIIQRGIEQGAREVSIENILSALTIRFPHSDIEPVRPTLETILSRDRLDELHRVAIQATNFEAFLQVLKA